MSVKTTKPTIEARSAQPYVAIRKRVPHQDFPTLIPQCIDAVIAWLDSQGIAPNGPPLMRYHVIDMDGEMDVAIGFAVAEALNGSGDIIADSLPAGRYANLIYTGVENGIAGNKALIDWVREQDYAFDRWDDANGDAFAGRVEYFLDGPEDDPDPSKWDTEVAIMVAD